MSNRTDTFNRADSSSALGTPSDGGGSWTAQLGTWGVSSNQAYIVTGTLGFQNFATLDGSMADADVQATMASLSGDSGLCVRLTDANNCLLIKVTTTTIQVFRDVANGFTTLGSYTGTMISGDIIRVNLSGSSVKVFQNGTQRVPASGVITETFNQAATAHGLRYFSTAGTARWDDFSITALAGGGPATAYPAILLAMP